ncbi:MAG: hypothetical protein ABF690_00435 [Liquorilactobacillus nagelii]|uniref:hypothetical protein n=1 Tax=Oenococcus sicerae TaxID=2203724 RepID=UPI0039E8E404
MYKSGDKIIAKIDEIDASGLNKGDNVAFYNSQLIGKLEDVNLDEKKITMTPNEKKEFDRLCQNSGDDIVDSFNNIADYYHIYPNLNKRLFLGTLEKNKYVQREFVRALEKPSLIEVVREKKYWIKLADGYLVNVMGDWLTLKNKKDGDIFTQSEIDELQKLPEFQAIDLEKCKMEVK